MMAGGRATAPGLTDIASIDARRSDDPLQEREILRSSGGRRSAVIQNQIRELEADRDDITAQMKRLQRRRVAIDKDRRKLRAEALRRSTSPARRQRIAERLAELNDERTAVLDALRVLGADRADVIQQAKLLGYDLEDAQSEEAEAAAPTASDSADAGVPDVDQAEMVRARTNMLMTEWNMTGMSPGDLGTGGATAMSAAFPGGRTVTLTVGATSLVSAVASASGTQGYSTPAVVPAGV